MRTWPYKLLALVAALLAAFAVGRYTTPVASTESTVTVKESVRSDTEETSTFDETTKTESTSTTTTTIHISRPDGTEISIVREEQVDEASTTEKKETAHSTGETVTERKVVERTVERLVPQPNWRVGLSVGTPVLAPQTIIGVEVDRRVVGPLHLGVRAYSDGVVGGAVKLTGQDWAVGASVNSSLTDPSPAYGLEADYRVLGPFHLGVRVRSDGTISGAVSVPW